MHKYIKPLMVCPVCKKELIWDISLDNDIHIINANVHCPSCNNNYFVKNKIACFIPNYNKNDDNWENGDNYLQTYFKENPIEKDKLMTADVNILNGADLYALAEIEKMKGNLDEYQKIHKLSINKSYTSESLAATKSELEFVCNQFINKTGFILDIASGLGYLLNELKLNTKIDIISTDISYNVLKKSQLKLTDDEIKRISFIAFDANSIPFKDNCIENITTNLGLQNMPNPTTVISELYRICSGNFYAISQFCPADDVINGAVLTKYGLDGMWIKGNLITQFEKMGWLVECKNSIIAFTKPTPVGEIIKDLIIDGIPVADSHFENCTMIFTK